MKKLILAVAIAVGALVSQAAVVNWSVNNIQSSPDTAVNAGWLVMVYSSDTAFDYAQAVSGAISAVGNANSIASGTIYKATGSTTTTYSPNDSVSLYMVVFDAANMADAKNYIVSDVKNVKIAASGADQTMAFGNMAGTTTANLFKGKTWTATGATPTPEPTSAVLLLLGVAGLALRRKQA